MSRKTDQTALPEDQKPTQAALALKGTDALAGVIDDADLDVDGLDEIDASDVKIASWVFNMKGKGQDGRAIALDTYYNTIEEVTKDELDLALISLAKSNRWAEYSEAEGKTKVRCQSWDRKTGTMEDGTERPCQGCPDAQWTTSADGKRSRNCGVVYNVLAVDREDGQPAFLRFKRTSLQPIQQYLQRYHIGKRVVGGKRLNYPLFAFQVTAGLKMSDDGKYSLPVLTKGDTLEREEILLHQDTAKAFKEQWLPIMRDLAAKEDEAGTEDDGGGDASFNPEDFENKDETPAAAGAGNRF